MWGFDLRCPSFTVAVRFLLPVGLALCLGPLAVPLSETPDSSQLRVELQQPVIVLRLAASRICGNSYIPLDRAVLRQHRRCFASGLDDVRK
jgi:hypothetical protein